MSSSSFRRYGDTRSIHAPESGPLGWHTVPSSGPGRDRVTLGPRPPSRLPNALSAIPTNQGSPAHPALYGQPASGLPPSWAGDPVPGLPRGEEPGEVAPHGASKLVKSPAAGAEVAARVWRARQAADQDPILIRAYVEHLLKQQAVLIEDDQLAAMHRMNSDAPFQDAVSAREVSRILTANGISFSNLLAEPNLVKAELRLLSALKTDVIGRTRYEFAGKETIDEAMRVFRTAHAHFSAGPAPSDEMILAHYLRPAFPLATDEQTIARTVKAIVDAPKPGTLRRVEHLVHLAARLQSEGSSLKSLLEMPFDDASLTAHTALRVGNHGGVAAMETFEDWYSTFSAVQQPAALEIAPPLDPDGRERTKFKAFVEQTFRSPLGEAIEAGVERYGKAPRHAVTMFYNASMDDLLKQLVKTAAVRVKELGEQTWYIEFDIINLGGLNAFFKDVQDLSDVHIRAICKFIVDGLTDHVDKLVPFYIHGDEYGLVVTGISEEMLVEKIAQIRARIQAYTEGTILPDGVRLADVPRGKITGQDGFGAHIGYAQLKSDSTVTSLREKASDMINPSKKPGDANG